MRVSTTLLRFIVGVLLWAQFCAMGETQYLAIFIDGKRCGYAEHNRVVAGRQVQTTEKVMLTISRFGVPVTVSTAETAIETLGGRPVGFEAIQDISMWRTLITGTVSADGKVVASSGAEQLKQEKNFDWPEGALMAEGLRLLEMKNGLKEGTEYSAKIFSPSMLEALATKVRIGAKKEVEVLGKRQKLTEVTSTTSMFMAGDVNSVSYVDDELTTMKTRTQMMGMELEMVACSKDFALSESEPAEFIDKAFVSSPRPLAGIASARAARYRIKVKGDEGDFKIPSTDNQKVTTSPDGTVVVTVRPALMPARARFGYRGNDPEVLEALKPNRFVQSDDAKIQALTKEAVGQTNNAAEAARKIESFVAGYIDSTSLSVGYASAAEVAESRQGDCSEFAVLTAALCRAAGIPARIAVGVAYVDEFLGYEDVFGGHAWTEAYIGGRWVGLDAAFKSGGRGGYDAGHITLATGSGELQDFFGLIFSVGRFDIENVTIEK
jgi:hypothetical protein